MLGLLTNDFKNRNEDMKKYRYLFLFPIIYIHFDFLYRRIYVPFRQIPLLYVKHRHMYRLILEDVSDQ